VSVEWNLDPDKALADLVKVHKAKCEAIALRVYAGVIERTPVVTGELRASWNLSHTSPDSTVVHGGSVGNPIPAPSVPESIAGLPDFPVIYVSNSTPYAENVENGGPKNAPRHMLQLTLESLKV